MTDVRITPARRRVLELLKLLEPATAAALAADLGLTEAAVRQHLGALERGGLVTPSATAPARPGRPAARWSLTDAGRRHFPDRHGELTVQIVDAIRDAFGDDGLARVIDARTDEQLDAYRALMDRALMGRGAPSIRARVTALATLRTSEGYMAEVVPDGDGYLLVEHHCPICDAAKSCAGFCTAELRLFGDALGHDVTVERTEHLLAGGRRCTYRVAPTRS
ncbi:MAG TPA: helix-turn-helix domain-containing protein [Acidimicrobiia bacterium]|nr:helix-turn-helix domain-containing protein [Acidimicrobiia bacterium]